tara:strand:- start:83 stop:550 length:468 start_codon:yes stop_codon:yes gene_type:complete
MIKGNVITNNLNWLNYIKKPNNYIDKKIKKLNSRNNIFLKKKLFFTLLLSDGVEIKKLNKKFRKKNKTTDILSFPFQQKKELNKKLKNEKEIYLGDIIINLNKVKNKKLAQDFKLEFDRLWLHGLVHLFGHDHKKNKDFRLMKKIEDKYFDLING